MGSHYLLGLYRLGQHWLRQYGRRARRLPGRLVLLCLSAALASSFPAAARDGDLLWTYTEAEEGAPHIDLSHGRLSALRAGDTFVLRLDAGTVHMVRIDERTVRANGDTIWKGSLEDSTFPGMMVLTQGEATAHATLSSPQGLYQLHAIRDGDAWFSGRLRRYAGGVAEHSPDGGLIRPVDEITRNTAGGPFRISQSTDKARLRQGEEATIRVRVDNISGASRYDTWLDLWFLLETTELVTKPEQCVRDTYEGDPLLSCWLGELRAGESRQLTFTVRTSAASRPISYSTVEVVSRHTPRSDFDYANVVRNDLSLTIYRDVVHDSDGDGLSDYNEELLGSDPLDPESVTGRDVTAIDLLAVKAAGVEQRYQGEAETRLNHLIAVTNRIYADSGVAIRLRLAGVLDTDYQGAASLEQDLARLTYGDHEALEPVRGQRRRVGADLVVLLRPMVPDSGVCGLANLAGQGTQGDLSADFQREFAAHSVINLDCPDDSVLAHETGHNLGLVHSRKDDAGGGTFSYSAGHGVDGRFSTVMGYPSHYHTDHKLLRFSNPLLMCGSDEGGPLACGVEREHAAHGADAVASLNFVRHQVADWYPSLEQRLADLGAMAVWPAQRDARILAAATADDGASYASTFPAESRIDVRTLFLPDPADVGELATLHMAVTIPGQPGLWQIEDGELRFMHNGLADLAPQGEPRPLPERLSVDLLADFSVIGQAPEGTRQMYLYFAYQLVESGTLVFTARPLGLTFDAEAESDGNALLDTALPILGAAPAND